MTDMMQSMIRFSWAMSLFGVRQTAAVVSALATARAPRHASSSFDAVSRAAQERLGGGLAEAFRTGDRLQAELIDAMFGMIDPAVVLSRGLASKTVLRGSLAALQQSASVIESAMPENRRLAWRELRNKLEAFENFQYADRILDVQELKAPQLVERLAEAEDAEPYSKLWLTEGLGFSWAEAERDEEAPRDLLRRPGLAELPAASLIPLHTGMGLSLARHALPDLDATAGDLASALGRFWTLCERNSRDGFALAAYEALGLIARQLAPDRIGDIDRELSREENDRTRHGAFWHGLGRGLYFVASQSLPGSTGRAVDKARREAPAGRARLNALSGLAWAIALVNFRQPELLAEFLDTQGFDGDEEEAVGRGIASATLLWRDAIGEESYLHDFCHHRPADERWRRVVTDPHRAMLAAWDETRRGPGPGSIFHYERD